MLMLAKMSPEIDWKDVYLMPFQTTKSTKLIVFQYKLSHRRLTTNTFLYKVLKLKENDKCTFSQTYKEDLIHLFWSCKYTVIFWTLLKLCLINHKILHKDHNFNIEVQCSLGSQRPDTLKNMHQINFCLLSQDISYGAVELQKNCQNSNIISISLSSITN